MLQKTLKLERKSRNITQKQLAKITGIPQTTISSYEKGTNTPTIYNLIKIADVYGISIDEFIGREIPKTALIDQRHNKGTINNNF